jgi:putative methyltransferase
MGKTKRLVSILKRSATNNPIQKPAKKSKTSQNPHRPTIKSLQPSSAIHKHASYAVNRLLTADATGRQGASLKSLTLSNAIPSTLKRAVFAVTVETLKYRPIIESIIDNTRLLPSFPTLDLSTALVLVRDLLLGEGFSSPPEKRKGSNHHHHNNYHGPAELAVLSLKQDLDTALQHLLEEHNVKSPQDLLTIYNPTASNPPPHPRTARVNTIKLPSINQALLCLQPHYPSVHIDQHLNDVLIFPPKTDLHDHPMVMVGQLILQSKASCMPAHVMQPEAGWIIIDACAAPGNKTTHLAAMLENANEDKKKKKKEEEGGEEDVGGGNKRTKKNKKSKNTTGANDGIGKILALDKDAKRLKRLMDNATKAGATHIIEARHVDFLSLNPDEYSHVDAILLDPSCSGSGTAVSRMDYLLPSSNANTSNGGGINKKGVVLSQSLSSASSASSGVVHYKDERVEALATFQENALRHAFKFPSVKRIVYSTCSLYMMENEGVVKEVMREAEEAGFSLVQALPQWPKRGVFVGVGDGGGGGLEEEEAGCVVRTYPDEDGTDGFFVARFDKKEG